MSDESLSLALRKPLVGWALVTAFAAIGEIVMLVLLFTVGGIWGGVGDLLQIVIGVGIAGLAVAVARAWTVPVLVTATAVAGAVLNALGSVLVLTGATGYDLAGLVSYVGFGLTGTWILSIPFTRGPRTAWSVSFRIHAMITGVLMIIGGLIALVGLIAIAASGAPASDWIDSAGIGSIGTLLALPAWCLRVPQASRRMRGAPATPRSAP